MHGGEQRTQHVRHGVNPRGRRGDRASDSETVRRAAVQSRPTPTACPPRSRRRECPQGGCDGQDDSMFALREEPRRAELQAVRSLPHDGMRVVHEQRRRRRHDLSPVQEGEGSSRGVVRRDVRRDDPGRRLACIRRQRARRVGVGTSRGASKLTADHAFLWRRIDVRLPCGARRCRPGSLPASRGCAEFLPLLGTRSTKLDTRS